MQCCKNINILVISPPIRMDSGMSWKQDEHNVTVFQNVKAYETKILCPIWKIQWKKR